jgi:hypothetical protein
MNRLCKLLGLLSLALILIPTPVFAGPLVMSLDHVTGPTGGLGTFEVFLTNTEPAGGQSFDVAGFSFELMLPSASGVEFTGANTATVGAPYLFDGTGGASIDPTFTLSLDSFPNTHLAGSDAEFAFPSITVNPGDVFGLGFITYSVAPNAPGSDEPITFISAGTSLSDAAGAGIDFSSDTQRGVIHVRGGAVPEPGSLVLAATALGMMLLTRTFRYRPNEPGR